MRWADTDSDDSDDEFQTHGNVVNTSLMVDLDVSAFCMADLGDANFLLTFHL